MSKLVFFIDEDEIQRRSCVDVLHEIFADTSILIEPLAPFPTLADYSTLVADNGAAALILDERLNTAGDVNYTGVELAAHLRAIGGNLPIFILTNYPNDDFDAQGWAVENIFGKRNVISDPTSAAALTFKRRLSRQIEIAGVARAEREQRYHDLLVKSAEGNLTPEEETELNKIEAERIAPIIASEREKEKKLDAEIEKLKKLLGGSSLF